MPFTWEFNVGEYPVGTVPTVCYRGPMLPVEVAMSEAFSRYAAYNELRVRVLAAVTTTDLPAVRTREVVLRALRGPLGSVFSRLNDVRSRLNVTICEKRNSVDVEKDLEDYESLFVSALDAFLLAGVPTQQIDLFIQMLQSNNVMLRVSAKCAVLLLLSFMEQDSTDD